MDQTYSYTSTAKVLHWLMALIWIVVWIMGMTAVYGNSFFDEHTVVGLHKACASTLLVLIILRIIWRLTHTPPPLPTTMSKHAQQMAKLGHYALYLLALLAMPISGWLLSSVAGKPILVAGLINLPPLTAPHPEYVGLVMQTHTYLAWFCGVLVLGHILIALKHHFIDKDTVLLSMSPNCSCHKE